VPPTYTLLTKTESQAKTNSRTNYKLQALQRMARDKSDQLDLSVQ